MTYKLLDDDKHIEFSKYVKKKFLSDCSYKVYGILLAENSKILFDHIYTFPVC